jgi:hypothetical protein
VEHRNELDAALDVAVRPVGDLVDVGVKIDRSSCFWPRRAQECVSGASYK